MLHQLQARRISTNQQARGRGDCTCVMRSLQALSQPSQVAKDHPRTAGAQHLVRMRFLRLMRTSDAPEWASAQLGSAWLVPARAYPQSLRPLAGQSPGLRLHTRHSSTDRQGQGRQA